MNIENITAPPPRLSPEMRYASLHRTVESGLAVDRTWTELVEACCELGRLREATASFEWIREPMLRNRALAALQRHGQLGHVQRSRPAARSTQPHVSEHTTIGRWVGDAVRFLFVDHMPLSLIVATVTFPIVVGLGGSLSSSTNQFGLLPLLALIPALSVVGLVGALGRRILVDAAHGIDDPPAIPSVRDLSGDAIRFLLDAALMAAVFLGPGIALTYVDDVGSMAALAAIGVGTLLMPMALGIRSAEGGWHALSPATLLCAITRSGVRYLAAVGFALLLFAPAIASAFLTGGSQLYLQISVIGPLAVAPLFVAARLFGQCVAISRRRARPTVKQLAAASRAPTVRRVAPKRRPPLSAPSGLPDAEALQRGAAAQARARIASRRQGARPAPAARRPAMPQHPRGTTTFFSGAYAPRPDRQEPAPRSRPSTLANIFDEPVAEVVEASMSDLSKLPGVSVVRGADRHSAGASSLPPDPE